MAINSTRTVEIRGQQSPISNGYRLRKAAPARADRAALIVESGLVHPRGGGRYFVESVSECLKGIRGIGHLVDATGDDCTCPDFEKHRNDAMFACQHLEAARLYRRIMRDSFRRSA